MNSPEYLRNWLRRFDTVPDDTSIYYSCILLEVSLSIEEIITSEITVKTRAICKNGVAGDSMQHGNSEPEEKRGRIIIVTEQIERMEKIPKPLRDQVAILLGTRQGFRTAEISSCRASHFDFENGDLTVLDSKKHRYLWVVLRPVVAVTVIHYLLESGKSGNDLLVDAFKDAPRKGRKQGSKTSGEGLSTQYICHNIFGKWSLASGSPEPITPRIARAYFCYKTYRKVGLLETQIEMRHDHSETTELYYRRITNWADHKAAILAGESSPFTPQLQHPCEHAVKCPFFQSSTTKITEVKS